MNYNDYKKFLEATGATYAWVSAADGQITQKEIDRFIELIIESDYIIAISDEDLTTCFLDMVREFSINFNRGAEKAQEKIEAFKSNVELSLDLLKTAQFATVANGQYDERKEFVYKQISELLLPEHSIAS